MSADDRYSRLKALTNFGYDVDWSELHNKTTLIAGIGGLGTVVAEILARVGISKLVILDLDIVEMANLNRMVFSEDHVGKSKVEAMKIILTNINPEVEVEAYHTDIMAFEFEDKLEELMRESDIAVLGLDNIPARQFFNVKCVNIGIVYVDAGLFRSGTGGYVHLVKPRNSACYQCTGSVEVSATNDAIGMDCSASLPTTVNIIASLQANHVIKHLLGMGEIPDYVSYNVLTDHLDHLELRMDPNCFVCGER